MVTAQTRSPSYPVFSLQTGLQKLGLVWKVIQGHKATQEDVREAMGYKRKSGGGLKALSAMKQFGLLDYSRKEGISVSERGRKYLHPLDDAEKKQAIQEAAYHPPLFAELASEYPGPLPAKKVLISFLVRKGFSNTGAQKATQSFLDTVSFVAEEVGAEASAQESEDVSPDDSSDSKPSIIQEGQINQLETRGRPDGYVDIIAKKQNREGLEVIKRWIDANSEFVRQDMPDK